MSSPLGTRCSYQRARGQADPSKTLQGTAARLTRPKGSSCLSRTVDTRCYHLCPDTRRQRTASTPLAQGRLHGCLRCTCASAQPRPDRSGPLRIRNTRVHRPRPTRCHTSPACNWQAVPWWHLPGRSCLGGKSCTALLPSLAGKSPMSMLRNCPAQRSMHESLRNSWPRLSHRVDRTGRLGTLCTPQHSQGSWRSRRCLRDMAMVRLRPPYRRTPLHTAGTKWHWVPAAAYPPRMARKRPIPSSPQSYQGCSGLAAARHLRRSGRRGK